MPRYRRNRVPGGTYFFTVNLHDRKERLLVEHIDALRAAVRAVRAERPFRIIAWVVLPEHMHAIWTLPPGDCDYSRRWQAIKAQFTKTIGGSVPSFPAVPDKRSPGIWQPRFWEHTIRDEADLKTHLDYVHVNPLKHGLVERVGEWPYSSFRHYVARGLYPANWTGGQEPDPPPGERECVNTSQDSLRCSLSRSATGNSARERSRGG